MDKSDLTKLMLEKIREHKVDLISEWNGFEHGQTRYLVIDSFLPNEIAKLLYEAFPKSENLWFQRDSMRERKKTFAKIDQLPSIIAACTDAFHVNEIVNEIAEITNINGLEPDPSLYAGGLSMMGQHDFLNPHIDNSHCADRSKYRRLNLLYYVTPKWELQNGGNLELWDDTVSVGKEIFAKFNRLVIMETNKTSWHSVNPVLVDYPRCCVSNYYFSEESPDFDDYYHVTSFLGRPEQKTLRFIGRLDNFLRQKVAIIMKKNRGKALSRHAE